MPELVHLIYASAASRTFSRPELTELLEQARRKNARYGVTGMLLYSRGSFFQVLEGESATVDGLFRAITVDQRHSQVTLIIREAIPRRAFGDWTMGYADISPEDADAILGVNDFFSKGESFARLNPGRAKKLLAAFKGGRWRARVSKTATPLSVARADASAAADAAAERPAPAAGSSTADYSFAFQPIIDMANNAIFSYEALIRGRRNESAGTVLSRVDPGDMHRFDEQSRNAAIDLAVRLGLSTRLNLNFLPRSVETSPTAISSLLAAAGRHRLDPGRLVLEILEQEIISDFDGFKREIDRYRGSGLAFAIDDFGSGYAGLNLLAEFQPDIIKLDMHLVRGIESRGPRQAIVRGIVRTCLDLGIDIIAEGVETPEEFAWLRQAGIRLYQGRLFAAPAFEQLPRAFHMP
jgi:EAL domain-containing protein (putative c-di-GMP-specific phosphodiesterase class I)